MPSRHALGAALALLLGAGCAPSSGYLTTPEGTPDEPEDSDPSAVLFDEAAIPEFELLLSDDAIADLAVDPFDDRIWVPATFVYDGQEYGPVGVRLKGENSFQPFWEKPALKVKFDEFDEFEPGEFLGLKELTLNNMVSDYSMMHERLAYRMYREAGIPAARSHHALLTVNGEFYGLYAHVENVDKRLLRRWYEDDEGSMFELADVDFAEQWIDAFELEEGPDDRTALWGVADALSHLGPGALDAAQEFLDLDQFVRYWAVGAVVGQFDAYPYSNPGDDCHVYQDPQTGRLQFLPHGLDETFYATSEEIQLGWVSGIIAVRCGSDPACSEQVREQIWEALDLADEIGLADRVEVIADQIEDWVREDERKPYEDDEVFWVQDFTYDYIVGRADDIEGMIGPRP